MNKELTIKNLNEAIKASQELLDRNEQALSDFMASPECNVYESLDDAEYSIHARLYAAADEACEGSYSWGKPEYKQQFTVGDKAYEATVRFDYGRHDKTYYFIEESEYSYVELEQK